VRPGWQAAAAAVRQHEARLAKQVARHSLVQRRAQLEGESATLKSTLALPGRGCQQAGGGALDKRSTSS